MLEKKSLVANAQDIESLLDYAEHAEDEMLKSILDKFPNILADRYDSHGLVIHALLKKRLSKTAIQSLVNILQERTTDENFCKILCQTIFIEENSNIKTTTFSLCIRGNYPELVKQLILMGVDPNESDPSGQLPLHEAISLKRYDDTVVDVLLNHSASVFMRSKLTGKNANQMSSIGNIGNYMSIGKTFISFIQNDDVIRLKALVENYPFLINMPFENKETALHRATQNDAIKVLEFLLTQNIKALNLLDDSGHSALQYSLRKGNSIITAVLLSAGAQYSDEDLLNLSRDKILELIYSGNYKNSQNKFFQKPKALDQKNKAIISMASLLLMIFSQPKLAPKLKFLLMAFPKFAKQTPRTLMEFFRIAHDDFLEKSTQACLYQVLAHPSLQKKIINCQENSELQELIKQINNFTIEKGTRRLSGKKLILTAVAQKNPVIFQEKLNEFEDILLIQDQQSRCLLLDLLENIPDEFLDPLIRFLEKIFEDTKIHAEFVYHNYLNDRLKYNKKYSELACLLVNAVKNANLSLFNKIIQEYPIFLRAAFTESGENIYHIVVQYKSINILQYLLSVNPSVREINAPDTNGLSPAYHALNDSYFTTFSLLFPKIALDELQSVLTKTKNELTNKPSFLFTFARLLLVVMQIPRPDFATLHKDFSDCINESEFKTLEVLVISVIKFCLEKIEIEDVVMVLKHPALQDKIAAYADHPQLTGIIKIINHEVNQLIHLVNSKKILCDSVKKVAEQSKFNDLLVTFPKSLWVYSKDFLKKNFLLQLLYNKKLRPAIKRSLLNFLEKMTADADYCSRLLGVWGEGESIISHAVYSNNPEILKKLLVMKASSNIQRNFNIRKALIFALKNNYDEIFEILLKYADTSFEIYDEGDLEYIIKKNCPNNKKTKIGALVTSFYFHKKTLIENMRNGEISIVRNILKNYPNLLTMQITREYSDLFTFAKSLGRNDILIDLLFSNINIQKENLDTISRPLVIFVTLLKNLFQEPLIEFETLLQNFSELIEKQPLTLNDLFQCGLRTIFNAFDLDSVNKLLSHPKLIERISACNQNNALQPIIHTITKEIPDLLAVIPAIEKAIATQDIKEFKKLIESPLLFTHKACLNSTDHNKNYGGKRLLAWLEQSFSSELLEILMEFLKVKAQNTEFWSQFKQIYGNEILEFAVLYRDPRLVELLLKNGIDHTPKSLELAAELGLLKIFEILVLSGANIFAMPHRGIYTEISLTSKNIYYATRSPNHAKIKSIFESYEQALDNFWHAIAYNDIENVKIIATKNPVFLQIPIDTFQHTALHLALSIGDLNIIDFLLEQEGTKKSINKFALMDFRVNSQYDKIGTVFTVLHYAILNKEFALVGRLLAIGADPNLPIRNGITPLALAAGLDDQKLAIAFICELIHNGAHPEKALIAFNESPHKSAIYTTLLILATLKTCSHHEFPSYLYKEFPMLSSLNKINEIFDFAINDFFVKSRLSWYDLSTYDYSLGNILLACEEFHHCNSIKQDNINAAMDLIKDKHLVEKYLEGDKKAIHLAVSYERFAFFKVILNKYPNLINQADFYGQTPFDYALKMLQQSCSENILKILQLLVERGATIKLDSKQFEVVKNCIDIIPNDLAYFKLKNYIKCWLDLERHARKLQNEGKDHQNVYGNLLEITLNEHQPEQRIKMLASMLEKSSNFYTGFTSYFVSSDTATFIRNMINASHSIVWKFAYDNSGTLMFNHNQATTEDVELLQAILRNTCGDAFDLQNFKPQGMILANLRHLSQLEVDELPVLVKSLVSQGLIENKIYLPSKLFTFNFNGEVNKEFNNVNFNI